MSKYDWVTPEEMERAKKRNKVLLSGAVVVLTVLFSAGMTLLLN